MTVAELIAKLQAFPPSLPCVIERGDGGLGYIAPVSSLKIIRTYKHPDESGYRYDDLGERSVSIGDDE